MNDVPHLDAGISGFTLPPNWDRAIVLKDASVNVSGLSAKMVLFLTVCQQAHDALFQTPLCVTSGNDGGHAINSKHSKWLAVDVRCSDVDASGQLLFLMVLAFLSRAYRMAVFDERQLPGAAHFHVEEVG
jgi:hypothetical protein